MSSRYQIGDLVEYDFRGVKGREEKDRKMGVIISQARTTLETVYEVKWLTGMGVNILDRPDIHPEHRLKDPGEEARGEKQE